MVKWIKPADVPDLVPGKPAARTIALITDLRDPSILPLLRPAPTGSDYADERRPGASDRGWFLARRAVTRSLVAFFAGEAANDVIVGYDAPGAPRVKSGACHVSVSGRGPLAAMAVSHDPVGIDVEILHREVEIIADVLHEHEKAALTTLTGEQARRRFLEIWTAKEAFLKALGMGLNIDPATIEARFGEQDSAMLLQAQANVSARAAFHTETIGGCEIIAACVTLPRRD